MTLELLPTPHPDPPNERRVDALRTARRVLVLVLAALLAYAILRAYRSPELIPDLAAWRLC